MPRRYHDIVLGLAVLTAAGAEGAELKPDPLLLPPVEVIGTTPLPGVGLPREEIAAPVQSATDADIRRSRALELSDFLNRRFGGVHVNEMQGNPYQVDVNYRGYTASPLLGTPQGLSIYLDGVRLNQPFGDVVSWDLIPNSAIASVTLMPGSNPLFGLNTLGGALSIQTKDGRTHAGTVFEAYAGRYGRRAAEFEHGGFDEHRDWFFTGNLYREDGWRDDSPTRVGQLFGKLGWRDSASDLKLTLAYANTNLSGNGLQEQRFLARGYASVYTRPDITENQSAFVNLAGNHSVSDRLLLSGNTYYRRITTRTLNGDINEESLDQAVYQPNAVERAALAAAGYTGFPLSGANASNTPFPFWRCIANVLLNDEPAGKCNGLLNRSRTTQSNYGFAGQVTSLENLLGQRNQLTAGAAYDASRVGFGQSTQFGYLNPDRSITGLNSFADGVTGGREDGEPVDTRVALSARTRTWSIYATDTLSMGEVWHLTLSGRYNRTTIHNSDGINPGGGPGSLDGDYVYERFNPAAGITFVPGNAVSAYLGYSEGSRAPTAIELGCADPHNPCRLPNAMAGDPPLNQVVVKTWDAGLQGVIGNGVRWNAGVFRADNYDDILFVAAPIQSQFGYFKNFAKTRRQGAEAGFSGKAGALALGANYTYLDATYRSVESVNGASNSTNDVALAGAPGVEGGTIRIAPGNRIPLIPQHLFKAWADWQATAELAMGLNMVAVGSSYARGNENNSHQPDGVFFLGPGKSGGYAVFNLNAEYRVEPRLKFFAQINNLLDRKYSSGALLGSTGFTDSGNFIARPFPATGGHFPLQQATFYAPGAPRTYWIGLRYEFGPPARAKQDGRD